MKEISKLERQQEKGKEVLQKKMEEFIKRTEKIDQNLCEGFKILSREMVIKCPEAIQSYSIAFEKKDSNSLTDTKIFRHGILKRVNIRPIRSIQSLKNVIRRLDDGFEVDLSKLTSDEIYLLEMDYYIDDADFIDSLVYRSEARETPSEEVNEYWIVAQLKHPSILKDYYNQLDIRDIDLDIDVAVHQYIKTKIPSYFLKQMQSLVNLTKKTGRGEKFKEFTKFLSYQKQKYGGKELEILKKIQKLFLPFGFKDYIKVFKDFHYFNCLRGTEFYEMIPFPTFPKNMKVVARTDLNIEKPAADGTIIFEKNAFVKAIETLFS